MKRLQSKLRALGKLRERRSAISKEQRDMIAKLIPKDVQAEIAVLQIGWEHVMLLMDTKINDLTLSIKENVIPLGETVKGETVMAVYNPGRVSYDIKKLDGYAEAHPGIKKFRRRGKASVSIRDVTDG